MICYRTLSQYWRLHLCVIKPHRFQMYILAARSVHAEEISDGVAIVHPNCKNSTQRFWGTAVRQFAFRLAPSRNSWCLRGIEMQRGKNCDFCVRRVARGAGPAPPEAINCEACNMPETFILSDFISVKEPRSARVILFVSLASNGTFFSVPYGGPTQGLSLNRPNQMFCTATSLSMQIYSLNNLIVPVIDSRWRYYGGMLRRWANNALVLLTRRVSGACGGSCVD